MGEKTVWAERRFTTLTYVKNLLLKSAKINRYERKLWWQNLRQGLSANVLSMRCSLRALTVKERERGSLVGKWCVLATALWGAWNRRNFETVYTTLDKLLKDTVSQRGLWRFEVTIDGGIGWRESRVKTSSYKIKSSSVVMYNRINIINTAVYYIWQLLRE